ncbi:hypothetical protein HDV00_000606 [Rhizophlyctis rosea]|nr:hypothetical protein HDV00_000606 [Rhizophlyctis rosea]
MYVIVASGSGTLRLPINNLTSVKNLLEEATAAFDVHKPFVQARTIEDAVLGTESLLSRVVDSGERVRVFTAEEVASYPLAVDQYFTYQQAPARVAAQPTLSIGEEVDDQQDHVVEAPTDNAITRPRIGEPHDDQSPVVYISYSWRDCNDPPLNTAESLDRSIIQMDPRSPRHVAQQLREQGIAV